MEVCILMKLKGNAMVSDYWFKISFFRCNLIRLVVTHDRFERILRCLYCTNNKTYSTSTNDPNFNRIGLVRWIINTFVRCL